MPVAEPSGGSGGGVSELSAWVRERRQGDGSGDGNGVGIGRVVGRRGRVSSDGGGITPFFQSMKTLWQTSRRLLDKLKALPGRYSPRSSMCVPRCGRVTCCSERLLKVWVWPAGPTFGEDGAPAPSVGAGYGVDGSSGGSAAVPYAAAAEAALAARLSLQRRLAKHQAATPSTKHGAAALSAPQAPSSTRGDGGPDDAGSLWLHVGVARLQQGKLLAAAVALGAAAEEGVRRSSQRSDSESSLGGDGEGTGGDGSTEEEVVGCALASAAAAAAAHELGGGGGGGGGGGAPSAGPVAGSTCEWEDASCRGIPSGAAAADAALVRVASSSPATTVSMFAVAMPRLHCLLLLGTPSANVQQRHAHPACLRMLSPCRSRDFHMIGPLNDQRCAAPLRCYRFTRSRRGTRPSRRSPSSKPQAAVGAPTRTMKCAAPPPPSP